MKLNNSPTSLQHSRIVFSLLDLDTRFEYDGSEGKNKRIYRVTMYF